MFVAVLLAFVVSYTSMKALHGMIEMFPEDNRFGFEPLLAGSMAEKVVTTKDKEELSLVRDRLAVNTVRQDGGATKEWEEEEEEEEMDDGVVEKDSQDDDEEDEEEYEEEEDTREERPRREEETDYDDGEENNQEQMKDDEEEEDYYGAEDARDTVEVKQDVTTQPGGSLSSYAKKHGFVVKKHTDYWGDALVWGNINVLDSEDECCQACAEYMPKTPKDAPCNVWVYCGDKELCDSNYKHCWLKYLAHPEGTNPANEGPMVGWTTGIKSQQDAKGLTEDTSSSYGDRSYHIVVSAQGTATHWQSRVHYYWYKKIKKQCEEAGKCDMGGFTRLLHSGKADDLMDEIPTFVANELPKEHPHHGYIVLNRPYAFLQWVQKAKIKEKYVLMGEPDHIWLKPLPNMMKGENPAAFPFFYIEPTKDEYIKITEKFVGNLDSIQQKGQLYPIGSSPTMLSWKDMKNVVPIWYNISLAVHEDEEAVKAWGWIQEMYAFTMSMYLAGIRDCSLHIELMSHPPWDFDLEKYYLLHYTYGMDYTLDGKFTPGEYGKWRFDKRSYTDRPLPRNLGPPPDGMKNDLVRHLINAFNEATDAIPGWDEYARNGVATKLWDGVIKDT